MGNRRTFIKSSLFGAGALALTPYTNAMGAAKAGSGTFPKRFIFMRVANGIWPKRLALPDLSTSLKAKEEKKEAFEVDLDKHELPDYLKALNDHKENMTILQGMSSRMCQNGHNSFHSIMGLFFTKNGKLSSLKRKSIDFELADLYPSPLGHVELTFANQQKGIIPGWSVPAPYRQNFAYADPITAYNNLFKCVHDPKSLNLDIDMLTHIHETEGRKTASIKGYDKNSQLNRIHAIEAIKQRNLKLMTMSSEIAKKMPDKKMIYSRGAATATSVEKYEAMTEIAASALTSGLTNVLTYTMDSLNYTQSGLPGGLEKYTIHNHQIGHNEVVGGVPSSKMREIVRIIHFQQVKRLVEALKAQPEGNGTMFDNTMIMYFPEGGDTHHSGGNESPWVVLSGKNCNLDIAGRYIRFPFGGTEGHKTLGNWYTSLLNAHGNPIKHYGDHDSEMTRKKLPQEGAIKRFIKA